MPEIVIPDDGYDALERPEAEREAAVRQELAVSLYNRGVLPFGKARALGDRGRDEPGLGTAGGVSRFGIKRRTPHYWRVAMPPGTEGRTGRPPPGGRPAVTPRTTPVRPGSSRRGPGRRTTRVRASYR